MNKFGGQAAALSELLAATVMMMQPAFSFVAMGTSLSMLAPAQAPALILDP